MSPYKNKEEDRYWHRLKMRERRKVAELAHNAIARAQQRDEPKLISMFVTPDVTPKVDADGNPIYDEEA